MTKQLIPITYAIDDADGKPNHFLWVKKPAEVISLTLAWLNR